MNFPLEIVRSIQLYLFGKDWLTSIILCKSWYSAHCVQDRKEKIQIFETERTETLSIKYGVPKWKYELCKNTIIASPRASGKTTLISELAPILRQNSNVWITYHAPDYKEYVSGTDTQIFDQVNLHKDEDSFLKYLNDLDLTSDTRHIVIADDIFPSKRIHKAHIFQRLLYESKVIFIITTNHIPDIPSFVKREFSVVFFPFIFAQSALSAVRNGCGWKSRMELTDFVRSYQKCDADHRWMVIDDREYWYEKQRMFI